MKFLGPFLSIFLLFAKFGIEARSSKTQSVESLKPLMASYESNSLSKYSFGMQNAISDWLWISLLQSASHLPLKEGEVSWEFAQVNSITTLDPHFLLAYDLGAVFLSVFRRDRLGAKFILEKWVKRQPYSWRPNYLLGYHLYFEMGDYQAASHYILIAAGLTGAPIYLSSLGVRLISETGFLTEGLRVAIELYPNVQTLEGKYRLLRRIRKLRFELEHENWVAALTKFREQRKREPRDSFELLPLIKLERSLSFILETEDSDIESVLKERISFGYHSTQRKIVYLGQDDFLIRETVGINRPRTE